MKVSDDGTGEASLWFINDSIVSPSSSYIKYVPDYILISSSESASYKSE